MKTQYIYSLKNNEKWNYLNNKKYLKIVYYIYNLHCNIKNTNNTFSIEMIVKKITHMLKRWGTPQNFFLPFIDELEKQIIIKKTK